MDNLTHTLVGAALARTGLARRTKLGTATLMIGANFPDVDVLAIPFGHSVDFRRGWTHGVLALAVLPFVLAALMLAWDRLRRRGGPPSPAPPPAVPSQLLLLSTIGILTHPALDWLNEYGMRWLMPFDGRWFYGDTVFIVDPWLLLALGAGVLVSRRRARDFAAAPAAIARRAATPARLSLVIASVYVLAMFGVGRSARAAAAAALRAEGSPAKRVMAAASFADPTRWRIVVEEPEHYRVGHIRLVPTTRLELPHILPRNEGDPAAQAAARTTAGRRFLTWSRFPFFEVTHDATGTRVRIADARYSLGAVASRGARDWAQVVVRVE